MIDLSDEAAQSAGSDVDLLAVIGSASSVDVETCQNLADGLVDAQDDLAPTELGTGR